MGCRYCMMACPFGIPRYEWDSAIPHIRKCTLCYDAMARGEIEQPACTAACPEHATVFFEDRDHALREAHRRIAENPGKYFEDRIWGEHEVGGTSVLYLSSMDLSSVLWHSFKPLGDEPLPERTERIMVTVPPTFFGVCAVMAGTYWVINRRRRLMDGEPAPTEPILIPPAGVVTRQSTDVLALPDPDTARALRYMWEHLAEPPSVPTFEKPIPTEAPNETQMEALRKQQIEYEMRLAALELSQVEMPRQLPDPVDVRRAEVSASALLSTKLISFRTARRTTCTGPSNVLPLT